MPLYGLLWRKPESEVTFFRYTATDKKFVRSSRFPVDWLDTMTQDKARDMLLPVVRKLVSIIQHQQAALKRLQEQRQL